jgi:hypothetical protein
MNIFGRFEGHPVALNPGMDCLPQEKAHFVNLSFKGFPLGPQLPDKTKG